MEEERKISEDLALVTNALVTARLGAREGRYKLVEDALAQIVAIGGRIHMLANRLHKRKERT